MIELTYPPMPRETFAPLWAFINAQAGRAGSFDFVLPQHAPLGAWAGSPVVDGAEQTGNTVQLKGFTPSQTEVAKAGDFVRFAGSYKTYQVTADASSDGSGNAEIVLNAPLVASPADEAVVSTDRQMRCALADDNADVDLDTSLLYRFKVQLLEVLY